ncbi:hypothetical protein KC362_g52 [Hortaea werneckii]|nr:hypothetical protein KC362_g52 [Hortaea werneckii]
MRRLAILSIAIRLSPLLPLISPQDPQSPSLRKSGRGRGRLRRWGAGEPTAGVRWAEWLIARRTRPRRRRKGPQTTSFLLPTINISALETSRLFRFACVRHLQQPALVRRGRCGGISALVPNV